MLFLTNKTINILKTRILTITAVALMLLIPTHTNAQVAWDEVFNKFKLEVRADGEITTTDSTPNLGFHGKYFNFMLGGDLGGGFSYYFKQRIVANPGTVTFFDNTDFLYLDYMPNQNWRLRFGKDAMALGGFEYDASPIDVYFPTNLWRNIYCFQLAASGAYITDDGNHTFIAQVSNSPYINYNNLNYDAGLVAYNLYWAGNMGHFHTLWSTSMVEYKWNSYLNMTMLGMKLIYDKWDLYFDFMHTPWPSTTGARTSDSSPAPTTISLLSSTFSSRACTSRTSLMSPLPLRSPWTTNSPPDTPPHVTDSASSGSPPSRKMCASTSTAAA